MCVCVWLSWAGAGALLFGTESAGGVGVWAERIF